MSDFDDSWWQASQAALPADRQKQQQSHQAWWRQQLEQQAAFKQAQWQAQRAATVGSGITLNPWSASPPGVNAPVANPLLSRFPVATLVEADPGNALAGYFMGQGDTSDPLMMQQLLGGQPGMSNV